MPTPTFDAIVGDMRDMPLADRNFDAAISVAAIDHLRRADIERALAEVARGLRPDGEFLLMVINPDGWTRLAYPFFLHHGSSGWPTDHDFWRSSVATAGFDIVELGTQPAMLYVLARKSRAAAARTRRRSRCSVADWRSAVMVAQARRRSG